MMKRTLKTVLKNSVNKLCINREIKIKISPFSYTVIVVT